MVVESRARDLEIFSFIVSCEELKLVTLVLQFFFKARRADRKFCRSRESDEVISLRDFLQKVEFVPFSPLF